MSKVLPKYILTPVGQAVTLGVTLVVLCLSIAGATALRMDFNIEWFVPSDSFLQDTFDVRDTYFQQSDRLPFGMYTKTVDYPNLQTELDAFGAAINASSVIDEYFYWHDDFKAWYAATYAGPLPTNSSYYARLKEFIGTSEGAQYVEDIVFTSDNSSVVATKIQCFFIADPDISDRISNMKDVRSLADAYGSDLGPAFPYAFPFLFFDGLDVVVEVTLINLAMAASAVFIISVIALASLGGGLIVGMMLISTDAMLLGSFYLTGVDFNMVSAVNLVIALGLAIDGNIHVMHAYLRSNGESRQARAADALRQLGASTFHGGVSSLVVLAVLGFAVSYVFQVFFRSLFFTVLLGYAHAILVLPVVLSLIGPEPYDDENLRVHDPVGETKGSYRMEKLNEPAALEDIDRQPQGTAPSDAVVNISSRLEHF
jgi:predicted RND superfamily exporter protein